MKKSDWLYANFKSHEFDCPCDYCKGKNTGLRMEKEFMDKLAMARTMANVPFRIKPPRGSGWRCRYWNRKIGGSFWSEHKKGKAVDIPYRNTRELLRIVYGLILSDFKRIQIYRYKHSKRGWVHVDNSDNKIKPKEWLNIQEV